MEQCFKLEIAHVVTTVVFTLMKIIRIEL